MEIYAAYPPLLFLQSILSFYARRIYCAKQAFTSPDRMISLSIIRSVKIYIFLLCPFIWSCPGDWTGPDCKNNIVFDITFLPPKEWLLDTAMRQRPFESLNTAPSSNKKSIIRRSLLQHLQAFQLPLPADWLNKCVTYNEVTLDPTPYLTPLQAQITPTVPNTHLFPELNFNLINSSQCTTLFPAATETQFRVELEKWCPKEISPFEVVRTGYGSELHFTMKAVNEAFRDKVPTYPRGTINIAEDELECGQNHLCFYEPYYWHGCTLLPADNQQWTHGKIELGFWEVPHRFTFLGFFEYRAITVGYIHRPNPHMREKIVNAITRIGWNPTKQHCIGVQIRRGDACGDKGGRRECFENARYIDAAKQMRSLYNLHCMYISTDDDTVPSDIRKAFEAEDAAFMANHPDLSPHDLLSQFSWQPMQVYDQGNNRSDYDENKSILNEYHLLKGKRGFRLGTEMLIDMELLAACVVFVGTFSSNTMRLAVELHYARRGYYAPYISLDTSWCYNGFGFFNIRGREFPIAC